MLEQVNFGAEILLVHLNKTTIRDYELDIRVSVKLTLTDRKTWFM